MYYFYFSADFYDIITVGAFTAYPHKYKYGGLRRMLQQQQDIFTSDGTLSKVTKIQRACELLNNVVELKTNIGQHCDKLCHVAMAGSADELKIVMNMVAEKVSTDSVFSPSI